MYEYSEIAHGTQDRGRVYKVGSILKLDYFGKKEVIDTFSNIYLQHAEFERYTDAKGGKAGYAGPVLAEFLHWDFDASELQDALDDTRNLLTELIIRFQLEKGQFRIWFTGSKGFHVFLLMPGIEAGRRVPGMVKSACAELAARLKSFDHAPYDTTRLWRVPNSKHSATGLFKIPLEYDNVINFDIATIRTLAKVMQHVDWMNLDDFFPNEEILDLIYSKKATKAQEIVNNRLVDGIAKGFKEGERNVKLTSLAGLLHSKGIDYSMTKALLLAVNASNSMGLDEHEIGSIARSVEKYKIGGEEEPSFSHLLNIGDCYKKWCENFKVNGKLNFGYEKINNNARFFARGEVFILAARSGVGKTTLGMTLTNNIASNDGGAGFFISLEMQGEQIFLRAAIIEQSKTERRAVNTEETIEGLSADVVPVDVLANWSNLVILDKPMQTLEKISRYIDILFDKYSKISVVTIDYLGYINDNNSKNTYERISKLSRGVKELAKKHNIRIILLVQTSRAGEDGTIPIKLHHLRDSGTIEESGDYILGMWRDAIEDNRVHCNFLKNRWHASGNMFDFINSGLNFKESNFKEGAKELL